MGFSYFLQLRPQKSKRESVVFFPKFRSFAAGQENLKFQSLFSIIIQQRLFFQNH
jgi:hypothetical protein